MRGVYIIKNLKTGKVYVGSSNHVDTRIHDHFSLLEAKKHYNWKMQKEYNNYKKYFIHGVVREFTISATREEIYEYEQYVLDSQPNKYNILLKSTDHLVSREERDWTPRQLKLPFYEQSTNKNN